MPADAVTVRLARPSDLRHVPAVEESGVVMFAEHLGDRMLPALASPPPSGAARDQDGSLLVAADGDTVVGFAHVDRPGDDPRWAHLQQLSVLPSWQRRGVGSRLVRAATEEARWAGCAWLSLCTYRDVPWNGPFLPLARLLRGRHARAVPAAAAGGGSGARARRGRAAGGDGRGAAAVRCLAPAVGDGRSYWRETSHSGGPRCVR